MALNYSSITTGHGSERQRTNSFMAAWAGVGTRPICRSFVAQKRRGGGTEGRKFSRGGGGKGEPIMPRVAWRVSPKEKGRGISTWLLRHEEKTKERARCGS